MNDDLTEGWSSLMDPLSDVTRDDFEREFPEIPTPDLCHTAIMFRLMRRDDRMSDAEIKKEIATVERSVNDLLERLDHLSDEANEMIAISSRLRSAGVRAHIIEQLRAYRSILWNADNRLEPVRGAAKGKLPQLVAAMARIFEANGVEVDAMQGGRFLRAIQIVLTAAGEPRNKANQLKSLTGSVRRALALREQNKASESV